MNRLLSVLVAILLPSSAFSQVIITSADMPVSGDTLRYSIASPIGAVIPPNDTGLSMVWSYALTYVGQGIDTYKLASAVDPGYASIGPTAYGYKVADTLSGAISIQQVYTFFENTTDSFIADGFGAYVAGTPTPANYAPADVWYRFPLTYRNSDSGNFSLNIPVPGGSILQQGIRQTRVDAWGVLVTPYSSGTHCLRVKSVIHEMDSVTLGGVGYPPIPRDRVEYKWLANGEHYPLLWVTSSLIAGTETITSIRYRDRDRDTTGAIDTNVAVQTVTKSRPDIIAYPNPSVNGIVTLAIPASWKSFFVEIFDMHAREVTTSFDKRELDLGAFPPGRYLARVTSGTSVAYVQIVK